MMCPHLTLHTVPGVEYDVTVCSACGAPIHAVPVDRALEPWAAVVVSFLGMLAALAATVVLLVMIGG